jgi:hypothetical protein
MKYLVELKFTNPAHEHVSLRRRVESVTRLVEAKNEDQAVLRASQQQRALGFFIKEAKIVKEKSHDKGADETLIAKGKEVMKKAEGKDEKDEEEAEDIEEGNGTSSYPLLKKGEKLKPMKLKMGEEVEKIDEEKKVTHEDPLVTVNDTHGVRTHAHLSTANDIHGTKVKYTEVHAGDVKTKSRSGDDLTFKISKHHAKEVKEEVELDEAKKPLKPSYWKAEWRLGTQSDVDKNNKKIFDRLAKTDPVKAAAFHDNLMRMKKKDMKKEAVDPDKRDAGYKMSPAVKAAQAKSDALSKPEKKHQAGTLGAHKARKAAERMVDAQKKKVNKINMNPSMEPGKHNA